MYIYRLDGEPRVSSSVCVCGIAGHVKSGHPHLYTCPHDGHGEVCLSQLVPMTGAMTTLDYVFKIASCNS